MQCDPAGDAVLSLGRQSAAQQSRSNEMTARAGTDISNEVEISVVDAPKPFWYLAGVAVLIVAGAVAYRILGTGQNVQVSAGDFSVTLDAVQRNVDAAQATVQTLTQQADTQRKEITALEQRLAQEQSQNQQLVAEVQRLPAAPVALRNAAAAFQERASQPFPRVTQVDARLIAEAQQHLDLAKQAASRLSAMQK